MKILFVIPTLGSGGAERALLQLVNNFGTNDDVTVMSLFKVGTYNFDFNTNIHYKYIFSKMFRGNIHFFKLFKPSFLFKKMIKEKYDVIISYLEGPTTRIVSGCPDGTRIINWVHTAPTDSNDILSSYRNRKEFVKCISKYTDTVFVADSARQSFFKLFPELSDICSSVIYNPINDREITAKAVENLGVDFDMKEFNIVTVGRLSKVKGFERLVNICVKLRNRFDVHLYIVGKGDEESRLKKIIKKQNAESYITLLGYRKNPYPVIAQASLYVCSSYREGYSTSVIESLILGVPVVTTMCSGMEEILGSENQFGIITENSEEGLLSGIERIIASHDLYEKYKEASKTRGRFFNLSKNVEAVHQLLRYGNTWKGHKHE